MIAVIPARTGSKRIPNKNFKEFHGRPIIEYSIDAARNTKLFADIVIATDGDYKTDCTIYKRKPVSDKETLTEFLRGFLEDTGYKEKYICLLYAAAPFVRGWILEHAYNLIKERQLDTVHVETLKGVAGMFWFVDVQRFLDSELDNPFFGEFSDTIMIPSWMGPDIDTMKDWKQAEQDYIEKVVMCNG